MRSERQVLFWLAAMLAAVLAILVLKDVLLPFIAGLVIAYALNPIAERLQALGLPRGVASAIIVALLMVVCIIAAVFLLPLLANQLQQLLVSLPSEVERLKTLVESAAQERLGSRFPEFKAGLDRAAADLSGNWAAVLKGVATSLWSQGLALLSLISLLLITPLVVFYVLVDWHPMLQRIDAWLPRDQEPTIRRLAGEINEAIAAFIRGQGLVCLVLGVVYAVGLSLIGLRYGLLIGLATGVLSFVPFVGWAMGLILSSVLAVVQFWPDSMPLIKVLALFAAGQALDAAFLSPKIVGTKIGLHPVWLLFALVVFSYLFGFAGVLVAVPMAAAVGVLVRFALELYLSSPYYQGRQSVEEARSK